MAENQEIKTQSSKSSDKNEEEKEQSKQQANNQTDSDRAKQNEKKSGSLHKLRPPAGWKAPTQNQNADLLDLLTENTEKNGEKQEGENSQKLQSSGTGDVMEDLLSIQFGPVSQTQNTPNVQTNTQQQQPQIDITNLYQQPNINPGMMDQFGRGMQPNNLGFPGVLIGQPHPMMAQNINPNVVLQTGNNQLPQIQSPANR
jgi:hypothetical protein